ncbi:MAG: hypothetical protein IJ562_10710 [Prevotella sp.]|nr:hypothetical protein [Prevotella sp.]
MAERRGLFEMAKNTPAPNKEWEFYNIKNIDNTGRNLLLCSRLPKHILEKYYQSIGQTYDSLEPVGGWPVNIPDTYSIQWNSTGFESEIILSMNDDGITS